MAEQFRGLAPYSRMTAKERLHNELDRLQKHLPNCIPTLAAA